MASKRRIRRKQCTGKVRHQERTSAVEQLIKVNKKAMVKLACYYCKFCKGYHIGHTPNKIRRLMDNKK